ncbi:tetratricopeptide repeat protein, partial [Actinocorallia lasiicapitis]
RLSGERPLSELRAPGLAVEESFRLGHDQLDPEQARAFALLAVADADDLPLAAAAAVLDRPEPETEALLESLADVHLLESAEPGRYGYHDLLRLFAREVAECRRGPVDRLLEFWDGVAAESYRRLRPGHAVIGLLPSGPRPAPVLTGPAEARRWAAREIGGWWKLVRQVTRDRPDLAVSTATTLYGLEPAIEAMFGWREVAAFAPPLLDAVSPAGDARAEARLRYMLGGALLQIGRHDDGAAQITAGLAVARDLAEPVVLAQLLNVAAILAARDTDWHRAVALYEEALALNREHNMSEEAKVLGNLSRTQLELGRTADALAGCERALTLADRSGDRVGRAQTLVGLGAVLLASGLPDRAIITHRQSQALSEDLDLDYLQAVNACHLARALHHAGRPAETVARHARSLAAHLGFPHYEELADRILREALGE